MDEKMEISRGTSPQSQTKPQAKASTMQVTVTGSKRWKSDTDPDTLIAMPRSSDYVKEQLTGSAHIKNLLLEAAAHGNINGIERSLAHLRDIFVSVRVDFQKFLSPGLSAVIVNAVRHGQMSVVNHVMSKYHSSIDLTLFDHEILREACTFGRQEVIDLYFKQNIEIPTGVMHALLMDAIRTENLEVMKMLLQQKSAIDYLCKSGTGMVMMTCIMCNDNTDQLKVVMEKMNEQESCETLAVHGMTMLWNAVSTRSVETINLLLESPHVVPFSLEPEKVPSNMCKFCAMRANSRVTVFKLLLSHPKFNVANVPQERFDAYKKEWNVQIFNLAMLGWYEGLQETLLSDAVPGDPSFDNNHTLEAAVSRERYAMARILMGDQRVCEKLTVERKKQIEEVLSANNFTPTP